jgi:hypothetical protein
MLKRVRWLGTGLALGVGGSLWAQRKVKDMAARYRPSGLANSAANRARDVPSDLRAALREGREAMRQRESELRHTQSVTNRPRPASDRP